MAEKRKLMAEMERVFRKVDEGVELFEDIMVKMGEANSDNQREKFQDDLKKEIKKLQRLRDQIKGWQNSNEVKDKDRLAQYRKIIEGRMEQFKDIERENKTKPHSKQGLSAEEKLDPRERERVEVIEFLQNCISALNEQSEMVECELENLGGGGGGGRKKRGNTDKGKARQEEDYRHRLDRHKYHVRHLELIMRLLNNETLETGQIKDIKEDIEDYISRNQEDDFQENEYIYEDLNMGDLAQQLGSVTNIGTFEEPEVDEENSTSSISPEPPKALSESTGSNGRKAKTKAAAPTTSISSKEADEAKTRHASGALAAILIPEPAIASKSTPNTPLRLTSQSSVEGTANGGRLTPPSVPPGILYASKAASASKHELLLPMALPPPPSGPTPLIPPINPPNHLHYNSAVREPSDSVGSLSGLLGRSSVPEPVVTTPSFPELEPSSLDMTSLRLSPTKLPHAHNVSNGVSENAVPALSSIAEQAMAAGVDLEALRGSGYLRERSEGGGGTQEAIIPPILGASPLGKETMTAEHKSALALLESATVRMPLPMDSERLRPYLARNPCKQPHYYAHSPPPLSDTLEYFNRLAPETLFFIFYYMEGTKAQYLAAKALKKQSWRFHKKYMMWFQRHEDPTAITDDYEQGTYVYFDFEKWAQRKKESFTFEYQYLEDRDLS